LAFGTTAPLLSVTVPTILPVEIVVWAIAMGEKINANSATRDGRANRTLSPGRLKVGITAVPFGK
jgi:hypothetical protein